MLKAIWKTIVGWFGFIDEDNAPLAGQPSRQAFTHARVTPQPPLTATPPSLATPKPAPPVRKLYEGKSFTIDAAERAAADQFLLNGSRTGPTPSQRQVLFSDATAMAVLAGAGSGKSTTLVQRVLFMNSVLKIDFSTMAVFTFTRKSRQDFIAKLVNEAPMWGVTLNDKQAQRVVRTFHSKALSFTKDMLGKDEQIFEFLGEEQRKTDADKGSQPAEAEEEELSAVEVAANDKEGFLELDVNDQQGEILKDTYMSCYKASPTFRSAIARLYANTLTSRKWLNDDDKFDKLIPKLKWMSSYDLELCRHVESAWNKGGLWPLKGVTERRLNDKRFELAVMGERFLTNGYVEQLDLHIVLGQFDGVEVPSASLVKLKVKSPLASIANKRRALLVGSDVQIRYIQKPEDLRLLQLQLAALDSTQGMAAPALLLRLPNEAEKPVFEALYAFGAFVETIGLLPHKLTTILGGGAWSSVEQAAIEAVGEFFTEFYAQLHRRNLVTFNQVFSKLGEQSADLAKLSISSLIGVKHLMIDEFQDISPLIVGFVRGVQGELLRKSGGRHCPTLMCVGDDWQSIYGWRGSSPHFLLKVGDYFPGASSTPIEMEENFRSSQKIIDCGEAFVRNIKVKSSKRGIASNPKVKDLPCMVGAIEKYSEDDIRAAVTEILVKADANAEVYILAATHRELAPFKSIQDKRLMCTTFHQSKGLEADYVILVGAPKHFGSNELKNALYKAARFPQRFDDAQRDEALRVAYVAATRARKFCLWFAEPVPGSVIEMVPAEGAHRVKLDNDAVRAYINRCI